MLDSMLAAVGLKVLQIVVRDNLTQRAAQLGEVLRQGLLDIKAKHPHLVEDVRGRGLLQGIQVAAPPGSTASGDKIGALIGEKAMELGVSGGATLFRLRSQCWLNRSVATSCP